jgi:hypothetical protein
MRVPGGAVEPVQLGAVAASSEEFKGTSSSTVLVR